VSLKALRKWRLSSNVTVEMDEQNQFELGMTVHDRHNPSPDDAVIVNLPDIPIKDFIAHPDKKVTVAEDNPGYDPQQKVVVVVYQSVLDNFGGEYNGESPISFDALSRNDIPYYGFPPERLVPDDLRYNTDPPESVGVPLIGENQSIQRKQMELGVIDRVTTGSSNRRAKTGLGNEINVGPIPANPGDSIYILPLGESNSADHAKYGLCVINLDTDDIGSFSATDYIDTMLSFTQLSAIRLKEQLSRVVNLNNSDPIVKHLEDISRSSELSDLENESQTVRSSDKDPKTGESDSDKEGTQNDRVPRKNKHSQNKNDSKKASIDQGLEELRSEARNSGSEDPTKIETENTRSQAQEYNRSSKVREYVKRRADGTCEGCGEPAPFTSKTGAPYLHAHHIQELSDGGEDTIESVIALCPNCHYRVHHGENGDEYNQDLLEIVHNLEDVE